MTRYQFHGDYIMEIENGRGDIGFVDLSSMEMVNDPEDVMCLFEANGVGELNPLISDEEKEERYHFS